MTQCLLVIHNFTLCLLIIQHITQYLLVTHSITLCLLVIHYYSLFGNILLKNHASMYGERQMGWCHNCYFFQMFLLITALILLLSLRNPSSQEETGMRDGDAMEMNRGEDQNRGCLVGFQCTLAFVL